MEDIKNTLNRLLQADSDELASDAGDIRHGFIVSEYRFILQAGTHCEIAARQDICSIPGCPSWFAGFINHRGNVVPIYDLELYFNEGKVREKPNRDAWFLLLGTHPSTAGFIIESIPSIVTAPTLEDSSENEGIPPFLVPFIHAKWHHDERFWYEIDHNALLEHLKSKIQPSIQQ